MLTQQGKLEPDTIKLTAAKAIRFSRNYTQCIIILISASHKASAKASY